MVDEYQIYATSALRESKNSLNVISEVEEKSDLKINLISGMKEAKIIAKGNSLSKLEFNRTYLYVDVGGGSTEYSILRRGEDKISKSFKIGTVRLLNNTIDLSTVDEIEKWITSNIDQNEKVKLFATGGNINKIQTITGTKTGKPISYLSLKNLLNNIQAYSYKDRMINYNLSPDRADVIVPALKIFILTMESIRSNKMFIPKLGLVDGMIKEIFYKKNGCILDP